ncbi:hypothetical protein AJ87_45960 [Rhizobium yanglingense]|nr:hypothetical protein AJ87_45960 [Rhizobium yanglingense]
MRRNLTDSLKNAGVKARQERTVGKLEAIDEVCSPPLKARISIPLRIRLQLDMQLKGAVLEYLENLFKRRYRLSVAVFQRDASVLAWSKVEDRSGVIGRASSVAS